MKISMLEASEYLQDDCLTLECHVTGPFRHRACYDNKSPRLLSAQPTKPRVACRCRRASAPSTRTQLRRHRARVPRPAQPRRRAAPTIVPVKKSNVPKEERIVPAKEINCSKRNNGLFQAGKPIVLAMKLIVPGKESIVPINK
ncbi:hypothetical protein EJB05_08403, partial [Eragrostis curvula]